MELDWSTFLLEIVNFLILLWILKRFLYRPVLNAIEARRKKIESTLEDAKAVREEALSLKASNEKNLEEWETRRQSMESALSGEIASVRQKMLADLDAEIERERKKNEAQEERKRQQWQSETEQKALSLGASFATRLLERLASPELEEKIFEAFMEALEQYEETLPALGSESALSVSTAYPLSEEKRRMLLTTVQKKLGRSLASTFSEDPDLLCGIRAEIGPWVLHANLKDELAYFKEAYRNAS